VTYYKIHCHKTGKRAIVHAANGDEARRLAYKALGWWENAYGSGHDFQAVQDAETFPALQFSFTDATGAGFHTEYRKTAAQAFSAMATWASEDDDNEASAYLPVAKILNR